MTQHYQHEMNRSFCAQKYAWFTNFSRLIFGTLHATKLNSNEILIQR